MQFLLILTSYEKKIKRDTNKNNYHRRKRFKSLLRSLLDEIQSINKSKEKTALIDLSTCWLQRISSKIYKIQLKGVKWVKGLQSPGRPDHQEPTSSKKKLIGQTELSRKAANKLTNESYLWYCCSSSYYWMWIILGII